MRAGNAFRLRIERLSLQAGHLYCVLGATGSGKTTLLRFLAGLDRPVSGRAVAVVGGQMSELEWLRHERAAVFQRPMLVSGTVAYNVELGLRFLGVRRRERRTIAAAWLERLQITHLRQRSADRLSGGETRLVALARALATGPRILLLDEPTSDLDPVRVQLVERVVSDYCREARALIVWTSHQLSQVRRLAHTVIHLHRGELRRAVSVEDFFGLLSDDEMQWLLYT